MSRIISDAEIWVSGYNSITKQQPSVFKLKGNALSLECNQEHAHHFVWHSRGCAPWSRDRIVPKFYFNIQKTTNLNCWHQVHWKGFFFVFFLHPQTEIKIVWAHWIRSQTYWVTSACGDKTTSRVWLEINSHAGRLPWRGEIEITCGRHLFCGHNFIITPKANYTGVKA